MNWYCPNCNRTMKFKLMLNRAYAEPGYKSVFVPMYCTRCAKRLAVKMEMNYYRKLVSEL